MTKLVSIIALMILLPSVPLTVNSQSPAMCSINTSFVLPVGSPTVSLTNTTSLVPHTQMVSQRYSAANWSPPCLASVLTLWMWASVQNPTGQTAAVYIGTAVVAAGQNFSVSALLLNLPFGPNYSTTTYVAYIFVTTSSGVVLSATSATAPFTVG